MIRNRYPQWDEEIIKLYTQDGLSMEQIGERIGWSEGFVRNRLVHHGIQRRPLGGRKGVYNGTYDTSKDEMIRELWESEYPTSEIAEQVGMKVGVVRAHLRRMGCKIKDRRCITPLRIPDHEVRQVVFLYIECQLTLTEIAKIMGFKTIDPVKARLQRGGIPLRTREEQRRINEMRLNGHSPLASAFGVQPTRRNGNGTAVRSARRRVGSGSASADRSR